MTLLQSNTKNNQGIINLFRVARLLVINSGWMGSSDKNNNSFSFPIHPASLQDYFFNKKWNSKNLGVLAEEQTTFFEQVEIPEINTSLELCNIPPYNRNVSPATTPTTIDSSDNNYHYTTILTNDTVLNVLYSICIVYTNYNGVTSF